MIYGAGQAGEMAADWLPGDCELQAFIDGNKTKQGSMLCGVPVLSPEEVFGDSAGKADMCSGNSTLEACAYSGNPTLEACACSGNSARVPDAVYLCVINREAAEDIRRRLSGYGFRGEIVDVPGLRGIADLRLAFLRLTVREIMDAGIKGDLAELGVYRGDFAREMNALLPDRDLLLFDTFEGFDSRDLRIEKEKAADGRNARAEEGDFGDTSTDLVKSRLPYPEKAHFYKGYFPDSLKDCEAPAPHPKDRKYCIVSLDTDLYEPTLAGLRFFYPRLERGGVIIIHDYNSSQYPGVKRAVREFAKEEDIHVMPLMDLHGTAVLQR